MFKFKNIISICALSLISVSAVAQTVNEQYEGGFDLQTALVNVDAYRSEAESVKISATVSAYNKGKLKSEKQYDVFFLSINNHLLFLKRLQSKDKRS